MKIDIIVKNRNRIAVISSHIPIVTDVQSALDLILSVKYEANADRVVLPKEALPEDFFVLRSGLAGEILQKLVNYQVKIGIFGDYTKYTSKPLKDFLYESNCGKDVFFTSTKQEAITRLSV